MINKISISFLFLILFSGGVYSQIIDTVCPGEKNVRYSVDNHPGSNYLWSIAGGNIKSGNGTSCIHVDWQSQIGLKQISVVEQNLLKCTGNPVLAYVLIRGKDYQVTFPQQACANDTVTLSGMGGDKYLWSNGDTNCTTRIRLVKDTTLLVRISSNECLATDTFAMKIKVAPSPIASFSPDSGDFYKDQEIYFKYLGSGDDQVTWLLEKSSVNLIVANSINVAFQDTGKVYVKLIAVNSFGCKDSVTKMLNIKDENIFVPNAFTPNGDGLNDEFIPVGHGIRSFHMVIYNSWGEEIFTSNSMSNGWDGTFRGELLPNDAFGYAISAVGYSGKSYYFNGTLLLFR